MDVIKVIVDILGGLPLGIVLVIALCIVFPVAGYFLKKGVKIGVAIVGIAAFLFVFPSARTAFMDRAGLTYDVETGILTNRDGETIKVKIPESDTLNPKTDTKQIIETFDTLMNMTPDELNSLTVDECRELMKTSKGIELSVEQIAAILKALQE